MPPSPLPSGLVSCVPGTLAQAPSWQGASPRGPVTGPLTVTTLFSRSAPPARLKPRPVPCSLCRTVTRTVSSCYGRKYTEEKPCSCNSANNAASALTSGRLGLTPQLAPGDITCPHLCHRPLREDCTSWSHGKLRGKTTVCSHRCHSPLRPPSTPTVVSGPPGSPA